MRDLLTNAQDTDNMRARLDIDAPSSGQRCRDQRKDALSDRFGVQQHKE